MSEELDGPLLQDLRSLFDDAALVESQPNWQALTKCDGLFRAMERGGLIAVDLDRHQKAERALSLLAACTDSLVDDELLARYTKKPYSRPSTSQARKDGRLLTLAGGEILGITRWPEDHIRRIVGNRSRADKMTRQMLADEWLGHTPGGRGSKRHEGKIATALATAFQSQVAAEAARLRPVPAALVTTSDSEVSSPRATAASENVPVSAPELAPVLPPQETATPAGLVADSPPTEDEPAPSVPAAPAQKTPQTRRRTIIRAAVPVIGAVAALGVTLTLLLSNGEARTPPPDGSDPRATGCQNDRAIADKVNVYFPAQYFAGVLELRNSPRCGTSWGHFTPTSTLKTSPPLTVEIAARRPADNVFAPFSIVFDGQDDYGDMLISRYQCVSAEVRLRRGAETSAIFTTRCLRAG